MIFHENQAFRKATIEVGSTEKAPYMQVLVSRPGLVNEVLGFVLAVSGDRWVWPCRLPGGCWALIFTETRHSAETANWRPLLFCGR